MRRNSNGAFWVVITFIYLGLLVLFGWQTWQLVNFLFPDDQLLQKCLAMLSFDIMAFVWGVLDLRYSFASYGAKMLVRCAWAVTFLLSFIASVLSMVLNWIFRMNVSLPHDTLTWGLSITLFAVTFNVLALMFLVYMEINARSPHKDEIDHYESLRGAQTYARTATKSAMQRNSAVQRSATTPLQVASPKDRKQSLQVQAKKLKADGHSNKEIAEAIGVNPSTVSRYLKS